jgi:hypothetical protein
VQGHASPNHSARAVFFQWLLAKCVVNTQFVANTLFTDEVEFTRDNIVNCHNIHVWVNDNPHTTEVSRHQHCFSINVWVDILSVQFLGAVVLPKRLTIAVDHRVW